MLEAMKIGKQQHARPKVTVGKVWVCLQHNSLVNSCTFMQNYLHGYEKGMIIYEYIYIKTQRHTPSD